MLSTPAVSDQAEVSEAAIDYVVAEGYEDALSRIPISRRVEVAGLRLLG